MTATDPLHYLSFLGTGTYAPARYTLDGEAVEHRFVQVAALRRLLALRERIDRVTVLLTDEARDRNWVGEAGLRAALDELAAAHCFSVEAVESFPVGREECELWPMFGAILKTVRSDERLVVDITHGFRSFPAVLTLALGFLQRTRNVTVARMLYGAWENQRDPVPILDLQPLLQLLDWAGALEQLRATGDARALANLAQTHPEPAVRNYGDALHRLADALIGCAAGELPGRARALTEARTELDPLLGRPDLQPLVESLNQVGQRYDALAGPDKSEDLDAYLDRQAQAAKMLGEHQQYMQALTLLREALNDIVERYAQQVYDNYDRRQVMSYERQLNRLGAGKEVVQWLGDRSNDLTRWRNLLDHAWTAAKFVGGQALGAAVASLVDGFLQNRPRPLPKPTGRPEGRRMMLVLNHKLTPEQEREAREKLGVTELLWPGQEDAEFLAQVPTDETLPKRLSKLRSRLTDRLRPGDCALVQVEHGVTYYLVHKLELAGIACYHATTRRDSVAESQPDGTVITRRVFHHAGFRRYGDVKD